MEILSRDSHKEAFGLMIMTEENGASTLTNHEIVNLVASNKKESLN